MAIVKGRGVRVEIATTFAAAVTVTAITNASIGVATAAGHGMSAGAYGYLDSVEGMTPLNGQAIRLGTTATDTFQLEGVDTTSLPAFSGSALFYRATAWATLDKATSFEIGGGDSDSQDSTTLIDEIRQNENVMLGAQTLSFGLFSETVNSVALAAVEAAALGQTPVLFRITLKDGSVRLARGEPSLPGESVQAAGLGTASLSVPAIKGRVLLKLASL